MRHLPSVWRLTPRVLLALAVLAGGAAGSAAQQRDDRRALLERDAARAAGRDDGLGSLAQPRTFDTMRRLLPQVQSIVEGTVKEISYDYLDCEGPRTIVRLVETRSLLGGEADREVVLRTFGGRLPNGHFVSASELPRFVEGARYLLVLRNTDWRFSPVVGDLAFRETAIAGRTVLVDSDGLGVTGVSDAGVERRTPQLTEAAGRRLAGVDAKRDVPAPPPSEGGRAVPCRPGEPCEPRPDRQDDADGGALTTTRDVSGRFASPAVLDGVGEKEVAAAIPAERLIAEVKRYADRAGVAIGGGRLVLEPRLGCWNRTPTRRPRS